MALLDDLKKEVTQIFGEQWQVRNGQGVPDPEDLKLSNDAIRLERATILYADLKGSTKLVNAQPWQFSAEIYKTFLHCAAKVIRQEDARVGQAGRSVGYLDRLCQCLCRCAAFCTALCHFFDGGGLNKVGTWV